MEKRLAPEGPLSADGFIQLINILKTSYLCMLRTTLHWSSGHHTFRIRTVFKEHTHNANSLPYHVLPPTIYSRVSSELTTHVLIPQIASLQSKVKNCLTLVIAHNANSLPFHVLSFTFYSRVHDEFRQLRHSRLLVHLRMT